MIGFDFLRPGFAGLLLLAPFALLAVWFGFARSRAELARWVSARREARFLPGWSRGRAWLRAALGVAALALLAFAALGPVRGYTYRAVSKKALDLVICLDTSRSMLAQDLRPSRLERAKREIVGLLDSLKGDRVALVAFSGDARDVTPLTRDRQTLEGLLRFVTTEDNREGGTDLAAAIEHALTLFDGRTGAYEAIVLLTDGEDLAGKGAAQAEEAKKRNIRVFVVGVGTEAGGKIPVVDSEGHASFLRDPDGNEVVTKLDQASLVALARGTGGEYLSAEQSPTPLEDLYRARVARIEGREVEGGERRVPYDRYQWPLALALACLVLQLGLRERVSERARRAEPRLAAALLPLLVLGGEERFSAERTLAESVARHRAGESELAEKAARAVLDHADALALPEELRARAHFALGVIAATRIVESKDAKPDETEALRETARDALARARALAGPGELRRDATYDLGALELQHAEEVRATLPEVSGQPPAPPPQALPGMPPPPPPDPEKDPLPIARKLYVAARTWLVERLRLGWEDEDTRADLELVQRRLHELDEIEKKREEEKKEQEQQQDQNKDQDENQDPKDKKQDEKDKEKKSDKDKDSKEKPGDSKEPQDPKEPKDPKDQKDEDEKEQPPPEEPKDGEPPQPPEGEPEEAKEGEQAKTPEERVLTREEVMQLLDKLQQLEKQQKALEAALRAKRRAGTKRDW